MDVGSYPRSSRLPARRARAERSASCSMYAFLACVAMTSRTSAGSTPSGSTWRSKRARNPVVAGAVRAARSEVFAHEACAAIRARRVRCCGVSPLELMARSSPSDSFTDTHPNLDVLRPFGRSAGTVVARHVIGRPAKQEHQIAAVAAGEFPFVGVVVAPPVRMYSVNSCP